MKKWFIFTKYFYAEFVSASVAAGNVMAELEPEEGRSTVEVLI